MNAGRVFMDQVALERRRQRVGLGQVDMLLDTKLTKWTDDFFYLTCSRVSDLFSSFLATLFLHFVHSRALPRPI